MFSLVGADKFPAPREEVNWMKTRARLRPGARGGVGSIAMVNVETVDVTRSITSYLSLMDFTNANIERPVGF